jgi:hypothetical protein
MTTETDQAQGNDDIYLQMARRGDAKKIEEFEIRAAREEGIEISEIITLREKFKRLVAESGAKGPFEFLVNNARRLEEENIREFRYFVRRLMYAYQEKAKRLERNNGTQGEKREEIKYKRQQLAQATSILSKYCPGFPPKK